MKFKIICIFVIFLQDFSLIANGLRTGSTGSQFSSENSGGYLNNYDGNGYESQTTGRRSGSKGSSYNSGGYPTGRNKASGNNYGYESRPTESSYSGGSSYYGSPGSSSNSYGKGHSTGSREPKFPESITSRIPTDVSNWTATDFRKEKERMKKEHQQKLDDYKQSLEGLRGTELLNAIRKAGKNTKEAQKKYEDGLKKRNRTEILKKEEENRKKIEEYGKSSRGATRRELCQKLRFEQRIRGIYENKSETRNNKKTNKNINGNRGGTGYTGRVSGSGTGGGTGSWRGSRSGSWTGSGTGSDRRYSGGRSDTDKRE